MNEEQAKDLLGAASIPFESDLESAIVRLKQEMIR